MSRFCSFAALAGVVLASPAVAVAPPRPALPKQIRVELRIVSVTNEVVQNWRKGGAPAWDGRVLTEPELRDFLKAVQDDRDSEVQTSPVLITVAGATAKVSTGQQAAGRFVGLESEITPKPVANGKIALAVTVGIGELLANGEIRDVALERRAEVRAGRTLVCHAETTSDATGRMRHRLVCVTPTGAD